jgi:hypothetical protein|tara:strand:- start:398 stop:1219 length:822 start_codon:yes stop_codon:yes gene_type:complete
VTAEGKKPPTYHRFLDEMGDTTFYGKGRRNIIGETGVSLSFGIGILKIKRPLDQVRAEVIQLQKEIEEDPLFNTLPSVKKRTKQGGFFFHACKDTPDVRSPFLKYIRSLPCELEAVVARKIPPLFEKQHHSQENEFYADLLSHLIKKRVKRGGKLVLNVAARGSSTRDKVFTEALTIANERALKRWSQEELKSHVVFNVQTPRTEPILNIADYLCWAVQRVFERGETRHYDYLQDRIRLVVDLYDSERYAGFKNHYGKNNPLTAINKISPPIT